MTKAQSTDEALSMKLREGEAFFQRGETQDALKVFLELAAQSPENPAVNHNLGVCYAHSGQIAEGIYFLSRSLRKTEDVNLSLNLATILLQIGRPDLSSRVYATFTSGSPSREDVGRAIIAELEGGTIGNQVAHTPLWLFGAPDLSRKPLKLYADKKFLPADASPYELLYRAWGYPKPEGPLADTLDELHANLDKIIELSPIESCDAALFPCQWRDDCFYPEARDLSNFAAAHGKKTLIFFRGDESDSIPVDNTLVFQTSLYKPRKRTNEFSLPVFSEDFVRHYVGGKLPIRKKAEIPTVSFCGRPITEASHPRNTAIYLLQNDPRVRTNFILRNDYWGGGAYHEIPMRTRFHYRLEYVKNLIAGDYVLCCRGAGNFSIRLFEILSTGRIPVFLDTWCVLPGEEFEDWKKLFIWVDIHDLEHIGTRVREFHDALTPERFIELQHEARRLWEKWWTPLGFYSNLYGYLEMSSNF